MWTFVVVLSLLWGGSFFFFKVLVAELPPLTIVMARVGLAALLLSGVLRLSGQRLPTDPRVWRNLFLLALCNLVVPFSLIVWSEIRISSGLAAILNATSPVFSVLVAAIAGAERLSCGRVAGVCVCLSGVVLLVGPGAVRAFDWSSIAQLSVLLATFLYAVAANYFRRFAAYPSLTVATGQMIAATILMVPAALLIDRPWTFVHPPSTGAWLALLGLAVLSTTLAYIVYFHIIARAGATNALLSTFLVPISALALGAIALHERVSGLELGGLLVILTGLAIMDGRLLRARRRAAA